MWKLMFQWNAASYFSKQDNLKFELKCYNTFSKLIHDNQNYSIDIKEIFLLQEFSPKFVSFLNTSVSKTSCNPQHFLSPKMFYFHKNKTKENTKASVRKTGISFKLLLLVCALKQSDLTAWNPKIC